MRAALDVSLSMLYILTLVCALIARNTKLSFERNDFFLGSLYGWAPCYLNLFCFFWPFAQNRSQPANCFEFNYAGWTTIRTHLLLTFWLINLILFIYLFGIHCHRFRLFVFVVNCYLLHWSAHRRTDKKSKGNNEFWTGLLLLFVLSKFWKHIRHNKFDWCAIVDVFQHEYFPLWLTG